MNDIVPLPFEQRVRRVQDGLAETTTRAGLVTDPYSRVVEAQSAVIGLMPEFLREMERVRGPAAEQIDARVAELPKELAEALVPLLAHTEQLIASSERVARRPLMTSLQIKLDVLPALVAAVTWGKALIGLILLVAAFEGGHLYSTWGVPETHCFNQQGGVFCGYWQSPPTQGSK